MTDKEKLIQRIKDVICAGERIPEADLSLKTRKAEIVLARSLVIYFLRLFKLGSLSQIGNLFNKDHATVMHSVVMINNRIDTDKLFAATVKHYKKQILDGELELTPFDNMEVIQVKNKTLTEENIELELKVKLLEDNKLLSERNKDLSQIITLAEPNKTLIEENTALKAQIKLLEDEVFVLQSRLQQVRPAKGESIRPYMGYVPAFR